MNVSARIFLLGLSAAPLIGCDDPRLDPLPPLDAGGPRDAGPSDAGVDSGIVDAGNEDGGSDDAGIEADGGVVDAGNDGGACALGGNFPAPVWFDTFPFAGDGDVLPGGLVFNTAIATDGSSAALVSGMTGPLVRPELEESAAAASTVRILISPFDLDTGLSGPPRILRAAVSVFSQDLPRARDTVNACHSVVGDVVLPNGTVVAPAAPVFTPFAVRVDAHGALIEPLLQVALVGPGAPPSGDAVGAAAFALRPPGVEGFLSFVAYSGAQPVLRLIDEGGDAIESIPLPDAAGRVAAVLNSHATDGQVLTTHSIEDARLTEVLAMGAATIVIVEETTGALRYDGETSFLPAGSGGALLILDEALALTAVRPLPAGLALDDLVDVDPDRFCGLVRGEGELAGLDEPIALESFASGTTGTHLVCFDSAGLAVGAALIVQGEVIGQVPASTLDRLSGGVGWSGGFRGALSIDDRRGGTSNALTSSPTDLDGALARFDRDARLIESRHFGTPHDSELLGLVEVPDGIVATGRFRGCIAFEGAQGPTVVHQRNPAMLGSDAFLVRFANVLLP